MNKYKKGNLRPDHINLAGTAILLVLLSSAGTYVASSGVQQYQPTKQSATMTVAGSDENMTTAQVSSATNETTSASQPNATFVEFISNIEEIRGHLDQALINKEFGN